MASPFDGLASIFTDALGQAVEHRPVDMSPLRLSKPVQGIYISRPEDGLGITQPGPILHVLSSVASGIREGDTIIVPGDDGGTYLVGPREVDGRGMVRLSLHTP